MPRDPDPSPAPVRSVGAWAWNGADWECMLADTDGHLQVDVLSIPALPVAISVSEVRPSTATVTAVASSATNVTLKIANLNRIGLFIFNDSTRILYIKFGTTASTSDFMVKVLAGGYFEAPLPCYTGRVDGIWDVANGNAYVTEVT